ncbi:type IV secretory system conjugative DNA transfer family protein [Halomonas litopenaei]|uniref:type IV secretory system conjugative DNA transfer family protein n=1 Tax=Halomonas litopenaei TaxID=2109328 RepID=UPI003FA04DA7|tara:strand:- start:475 stop:1947 length:1473 start_codon:yes stop_codon:yes gene_type:complete
MTLVPDDSPLSPRRLPSSVEGDGLLVGWSLEQGQPHQPFGFRIGAPTTNANQEQLDPILFEGSGHLMTIAPTGSGKGTGCIIPTLLRYPGPVIVVDPKGENAAVTARRRRQMGHRVIVLDPMGITDLPADRLDPTDIVIPNSRTELDDIAMLSELMMESHGFDGRDRFWLQRAQQVLNGLLLYLIRSQPEQRKGLLGKLRKMVSQDTEELAKLAERMRQMQDPDLEATAASLTLPAETTLAGYMAFAQNSLGFLRGEAVLEATQDSTFSLDDVTRGELVSIYLVIPPEKLESHGRLLRLWIGVLIAAVVRRRRAPALRTLFLLDEAPQLGPLPQLRQAITLLRGYGLQTWSFWQDISQLRQLYPQDWQTMLNNCRVVQSFGVPNMNAAMDLATLTGFPRPEELLDLDFDEMLLLIAGDEARLARRPEYRSDPLFRGQFDRNPLHDSSREIMPQALRPQRRLRRVSPSRPKPTPPPVVDPAFLDRLLAQWA